MKLPRMVSDTPIPIRLFAVFGWVGMILCGLGWSAARDQLAARNSISTMRPSYPFTATTPADTGATWHSKPYGVVYHTNARCTLGNNIEDRNLELGTGGLPKCSECIGLDSGG